MEKNELLLKATARVIRRLRNEKGLSQFSLSIAVGIEKKYLFLIEKGQRNPSITVCHAVATALGVSFAAFCAMIEDELTQLHETASLSSEPE